MHNWGYFFEFFRRARSARRATAEKPEKVSLLCTTLDQQKKKKNNKTLTLFGCQCNEHEITKLLEVGPPIYVVIRATRKSGHCKAKGAKALPRAISHFSLRVSVRSRSVPGIEPHYLPLCSRVLHRLSYSPAADLATERERHLTTRKRAKRTKFDFRCPICCSAIGQAKTSLSDARQAEVRPSPFLYTLTSTNLCC